MPFYTYAFPRSTNGAGKRYLIITDSRETADFIYRGLFDQEDTRFGLRRMSPQIWMLNQGSIKDLVRDINNGKYGENTSLHQARGKVLVQVLPNVENGNTFPILPNVGLLDYTSGRTFFIRNRMNQTQFWYFGEENNFITPSTIYRSGFQIRLVSGQGGLMVDTDQVELYVYGSSQHQKIGLDAQNFLLTNGANFDFPFEALKFKFYVTAAAAIAAPAPAAGPGAAAPRDRITWSTTTTRENPADVWELCP